MSPLAILAASNLAQGPEASKLPFYAVGGALAVWAVVLSAIGLGRPEFPGGEAAARGVMLLSVGLMVGAMATAVIVS